MALCVPRLAMIDPEHGAAVIKVTHLTSQQLTCSQAHGQCHDCSNRNRLAARLVVVKCCSNEASSLFDPQLSLACIWLADGHHRSKRAGGHNSFLYSPVEEVLGKAQVGAMSCY